MTTLTSRSCCFLLYRWLLLSALTSWPCSRELIGSHSIVLLASGSDIAVDGSTISNNAESVLTTKDDNNNPENLDTLEHSPTNDQQVQEEEDDELGADVEPHPDPNDEHYEGMIYVGKMTEDGRRVGYDQDNGIKFIFGTSFDETHKAIEEKDMVLYHQHHTPTSSDNGDLPDHVKLEKQRRQRHDLIHGQTDPATGKHLGPKKFGHVHTHPLDGGVMPPKIVHVDPYFLDEKLVSNKDFGKFVRATYYETEAEKFGWSFVLSSFFDKDSIQTDGMVDENDELEADPEAEHWIAVPGAYWRRPEGPKSTYKYRENHPVVHVTHRDAAEYCKWVGKRLPGEWEWEAAARANHWGPPQTRTMYPWGDEDDDIVQDESQNEQTTTKKNWSTYANLWGSGDFPYENHAEDGWRGTNPVTHYHPINELGFYDMVGNVWEWQRGGKHKERIVRGGSYVDTVDGLYNHAATLGARATLHGTTSTGNVGFRCAKAPKRRTEYHYVYHDESVHGQLAVENKFGKRDYIPQRGWEDQPHPFQDEEDESDDDDFDVEPQRVKKKVIKRRERHSNEL